MLTQLPPSGRFLKRLVLLTWVLVSSHSSTVAFLESSYLFNWRQILELLLRLRVANCDNCWQNLCFTTRYFYSYRYGRCGVLGCFLNALGWYSLGLTGANHKIAGWNPEHSKQVGNIPLRGCCLSTVRTAVKQTWLWRGDLSSNRGAAHSIHTIFHPQLGRGVCKHRVGSATVAMPCPCLDRKESD